MPRTASPHPRPTLAAGSCPGAARAFASHGGRREERTDSVVLQELHRFSAQLGREIDEIVDRDALAIERRRLGWKRLRARGALPRHVGRGNGPLFDRPYGPSGRAVEDERERLLRELHDRLDRLSIDSDVGEDRSRRQVVVPQIVVDDLIVPRTFAGQASDAHERVGKDIVTEPVPTVHVAGRRRQRQIGQPLLLVGADERPQVRLAAVRPGVVLPGLAANLARTRNRIERPSRLAGAHVEGLHDPRRRLFAHRPVRHRAAGPHADDDDVAADLGHAGPRIPGRARTETRPQVDPALVAERRQRRPVRGSSAIRYSPRITKRRRSVPSAQYATPRALSPRSPCPVRRKRFLDPERLARARMKRLDQPDGVRAVQHTANHQRCRAEVARIGEVGDLRLMLASTPGRRHATRSCETLSLLI